MITSLSFLSLRVLASSLPSHLAFMSFSNASSSSLLFVSINTLPFFSDLKEFIPTLISVGLILVFSRSSMESGDGCSLELKVSLNFSCISC